MFQPFLTNARVRVVDSAEKFAGRIGYVKAFNLGKLVLSEEPLNNGANKRNLFSVNPKDAVEHTDDH